MMRPIDESRLESDVQYRVEYLTEFLGFGTDEVAAIRNVSGRLLPMVPALVDAVYEQLFRYDATRRYFVPKTLGDHEPAALDAQSLPLDHEYVRFRKQHLARYLRNLLTGPYDAKMAQFLDRVGRIHTPQLGDPELHVPLVQMNALLGFVCDALQSAVHGLGWERATEQRTVRALTKLVFLQNDLINRHYQQPAHLATAHP